MAELSDHGKLIMLQIVHKKYIMLVRRVATHLGIVEPDDAEIFKSVDAVVNVEAAPTPEPAPKKRGRGRPKGSTNKKTAPMNVTVPTADQSVPASSDLGEGPNSTGPEHPF